MSLSGCGRKKRKKAALATIVQIRGAVPSFQTVKMRVREDGSTLGSVGSGVWKREFGQRLRKRSRKRNPEF